MYMYFVRISTWCSQIEKTKLNILQKKNNTAAVKVWHQKHIASLEILQVLA